MNDEVGQGKPDIPGPLLYCHHGFVGRNLKADDKLVPFPAKAVPPKGRSFIRMGKLYLVVKGSFLGNRKQRNVFTRNQAFFARRFMYQAFHDTILAHDKTKLLVFNNDVLFFVNHTIHCYLPPYRFMIRR
jgi:hypothetical protein